MKKNDLKEVYRYVNAMRNSKKKVYADYYLAWKLNPDANNRPDDMGLSYMGAQAVRININKLLEN